MIMREPNVLLSVVVPTTNRPDTLIATLKGIEEQSFRDYEVIIVNNGTKPELVEQYQRIEEQYDDRFIFLNFHNELAQGFGPAIARNIGIQKASGSYIAFCDDDDKWIETEYLASIKNVIELYQPDIVLSDQQGINQNGSSEDIVRPKWFENITSEKYSINQNGFYKLIDFKYFENYPEFPHLNISVYKKSLLDSVGGFSRELWYEEDFELFIKCALQSDTIYYNNVLAAAHYIPNKLLNKNITSNVTNIHKHVNRFNIANKLVAQAAGSKVESFVNKLLTNSAKHLSSFHYEHKSYKQALAFNKFNLSISFSIKWWLWSVYLSLLAITK